MADESASTSADVKEIAEQSTCLVSEESRPAGDGNESVGHPLEESEHTKKELNDANPDTSAGGAVLHDSLQHADQHGGPNSEQSSAIPASIHPSSEETATNGTGTAPSTEEKLEQAERKPADSDVTESKLEASIESGDSTKSTTDEPKTRERKRKSGWDTNTEGISL
jgi:hypothetical protein